MGSETCRKKWKKSINPAEASPQEAVLLTSLIIKMNEAGEIVKIQLKSTSGIKELDQVAIDSFNQAGPFPNPPKGMMKNGLATIQWGFAVESN